MGRDEIEAEITRLTEEHEQLEGRLVVMQKRLSLSTEEQLEAMSIKKAKLLLKDELERHKRMLTLSELAAR